MCLPNPMMIFGKSRTLDVGEDDQVSSLPPATSNLSSLASASTEQSTGNSSSPRRGRRTDVTHQGDPQCREASYPVAGDIPLGRSNSSKDMSANYGPNTSLASAHSSHSPKFELVMGSRKHRDQQLLQDEKPESDSRLPEVPLDSISFRNEPDYLIVQAAADCLHAQDFSKMVSVLSTNIITIPILYGRGLAYYKLRKFQEAVKYFTEMDQLATLNLAESGNRFLAHYYLGEIEVAHGQHRRAAKHFSKVHNIAFSL